MKNLLIFSAPGIWPMLEYEIDIIQRAIDDGFMVYYLQCSGGMTYCIANRERKTDLFNPMRCVRCKSRVKEGLGLINGQENLVVIDYPVPSSECATHLEQLKVLFDKATLDIPAIKELVDIDDIDIYNSAISTLMSTLADSKPDLKEYSSFLHHYLIEGLISYYSFHKLLGERSFSKIIIFNGRVSRYRPALRICQRRKLNVFLSEYPELDFSRYPLTPDTYSHDFAHRSKILRSIADSDREHNSKEERVRIGEQIILDSLNQVEAHGNFIANFVVLQEKKALPEGWNPERFNIVVFTGSDFEMAGIPEYYENLPEGSQPRAISKLWKFLPQQNIDMTVRVHPNQRAKDLKAANLIYDLQKEGIRVVHASSKVDSYELLKHADLVITFGSQLSVESAYLGKHVIVLGNSMYTSFNFSVNLFSVEDAANVIRDCMEDRPGLFIDPADRKEEACLHMYARKHDGIVPLYLERHSYTGGEILINNKRTVVTDSKWVHFFTKYVGMPIVLINEYRYGGMEKLKYITRSVLGKNAQQ